jgi:hypothetical protein
MDTLQFYPTTAALAAKAWSLFRDRNFQRVLDPSGGNGDLLLGCPSFESRRSILDAVEIDTSKHATLQSHGIKVVGLDFEHFESAACYSHIIANPPFSKGCAHVLHAWSTLFNGEIVAILNAQTILNPFSSERLLLKKLIEQHGSVEFIKDAFSGPDAARSTSVEIALVYLRKEAVSNDIIGDIIGDLKRDEFEETDVAADLPLMIPEKFVENTVLTFRAAVEAMRQAAHAEVRAAHYAAGLGPTMVFRSASANVGAGAPVANNVRDIISQKYDELKDRAWAHVLNSTQVREKLSTNAQKRLESEFAQIKQLEFTVANVYGFLEGLCASGWDLQLEMASDVFDLVTRFHSENVVHYMGWKSNDQHRACGMRMRTKRFVLPGHRTESYSQSLDYQSERVLGDMDKVFAMLDGKNMPEVSLVDTFRTQFAALRSGERVTSSYFDVRYYPGQGTIHFFPRQKTLVDRLNRMVGQHRKWLPPSTEQETTGFWQQYEKAEKLDGEIRQAFADLKVDERSNHWIDDAFAPHKCGHEKAHQRLMDAITSVLNKHQIDIETGIETKRTQQLAINE